MPTRAASARVVSSASRDPSRMSSSARQGCEQLDAEVRTGKRRLPATLAGDSKVPADGSKLIKSYDKSSWLARSSFAATSGGLCAAGAVAAQLGNPKTPRVLKRKKPAN